MSIMRRTVKAYLTLEASYAASGRIRAVKATRLTQQPPTDNGGVVLELEIMVDDALFLPQKFPVVVDVPTDQVEAPTAIVVGGKRKIVRRG